MNSKEMKKKMGWCLAIRTILINLCIRLEEAKAYPYCHVRVEGKEKNKGGEWVYGESKGGMDRITKAGGEETDLRL